MLWEWTAKDKFGKVIKNQAYGPDCSALAFRGFLASNFRNTEILSLVALPQSEYKPPTGSIERHTYNFGIIDEVERELGLVPNQPIHKTIQQKFFEQRKPLSSILDAVKPYLRK